MRNSNLLLLFLTTFFSKIYKSPHSVICILSTVHIFTIKFLCLEIVRHSFHTRVSSDSYAIVQCLVKKDKRQQWDRAVKASMLCSRFQYQDGQKRRKPNYSSVDLSEVEWEDKDDFVGSTCQC